MTEPRDRRALLRQLYGFDFPDDLFRFWEFARRLRPLEPLRALAEPLAVTLVGPFDVLAGRCDRHLPRLSMRLHWRYYDDPPEFFTVAAGQDGLHWGYYLDDPPSGPFCVSSYYAREAYQLSGDGDDLFEALRLHLEYCYLSWVDADEDGAELDALREELMQYATGDREETGGAYLEAWDGVNARWRRVVARTVEGMGIIVPRRKYRRVGLKGVKYWPYLKRTDDPVLAVEAARRALKEGFPGTALKVGKDLWALNGERKMAYACELLDAAYEALGRPILREVLRTHRAHRELPSVDLFQHESDDNGHS